MCSWSAWHLLCCCFIVPCLACRHAQAAPRGTHTLISTPDLLLLTAYRVLLLMRRMLIAAQQTVGLKRYTVEDAAFGYWLQAWDLRHINQTRFRCACCLYSRTYATERESGVF
jgi:hypothetical protein